MIKGTLVSGALTPRRLERCDRLSRRFLGQIFETDVRLLPVERGVVGVPLHIRHRLNNGVVRILRRLRRHHLLIHLTHPPIVEQRRRDPEPVLGNELLLTRRPRETALILALHIRDVLKALLSHTRSDLLLSITLHLKTLLLGVRLVERGHTRNEIIERRLPTRRISGTIGAIAPTAPGKEHNDRHHENERSHLLPTFL